MVFHCNGLQDITGISKFWNPLACKKKDNKHFKLDKQSFTSSAKTDENSKLRGVCYRKYARKAK